MSGSSSSSSSSSVMSGIAPLLGSMANALKTTVKNPTSASSSPADRALGAAASLGLCLAILRVVGSAYTASKHIESGDPYDSPRNTTSRSGASSSSSLSQFLLSYVRSFLRRVLLEDDVDVMEDDVDPNPSSCITHAGSCHCQSVQFEVVAPRSLQARDGIGKIQYRHTKVKTSNLKVFKGHECLKTYYVVSDGSHDKGAHAFCQQCGVHILYAPWKNSPHLFINVNCLAEGIRKVRVTNAIDNMLDTVHADGQWETQSTVSEVSGDSRWNIFHHQDSNLSGASASDTWRHDRIDEHSVSPSISDYSYARKPHPVVSISPTLTSATEASSDASSVMRYDADDSTVRSYRSARTATSISLRTLNSQSVSPADQQLSPAMRDQMKKYMERHLSPSGGNSGASASASGAGETNRKAGSGDKGKITTMKRQPLGVAGPSASTTNTSTIQ